MTEQKRSAIKNVFFPKITWGYCLRLLCITIFAYIFFRYLCIPSFVKGISMEPTFKDGTFVFCWTPAYKQVPPTHGDVVMIRYGSDRVMLLKRVLAVAGDVIEFREGILYLNNDPAEGEWLNLTPCDWNMEPHTVSRGHVYVIGDNRTMPMDDHIFGEVDMDLIVGKPVDIFNRFKTGELENE